MCTHTLDRDSFSIVTRNIVSQRVPSVPGICNYLFINRCFPNYNHQTKKHIQFAFDASFHKLTGYLRQSRKAVDGHKTILSAQLIENKTTIAAGPDHENDLDEPPSSRELHGNTFDCAMNVGFCKCCFHLRGNVFYIFSHTSLLLKGRGA